MATNLVSDEFSQRLVDDVFEIWVDPEMRARGLEPVRESITHALVELPPDGPVIVRLNDEVELHARVRVTRSIEAGENILDSDVDSIDALLPGPTFNADAGWVALLRFREVLVVAFSFRYNRGRANALLDIADQYLAVARYALSVAHLHATVENALAAAELAVKAEMYLLALEGEGHLNRIAWWEQWASLGNAPTELGKAVRPLYEVRGAARYGDTQLALSAADGERSVAAVASIIDHARKEAHEGGVSC